MYPAGSLATGRRLSTRPRGPAAEPNNGSARVVGASREHPVTSRINVYREVNRLNFSICIIRERLHFCQDAPITAVCPRALRRNTVSIQFSSAR